MPQPLQSLLSNSEGRIVLAIQAIKLNQFQSLQAAAALYDVLYSTFYYQINSIPSQHNCTPNSRKLSLYKEEAIVQYILDLDLRGFPL